MPTPCRKCDELKAPNAKGELLNMESFRFSENSPPGKNLTNILLTGSEEGGKESKSEVSGYLVGFAKRVVLCTILVFAFK